MPTITVQKTDLYDLAELPDTLTLEDVAVNSSSTTLGRPLLKTLAANFTFV